MSEDTPRPQDNRRKPSLNDTTAVSMTTAGAGVFVVWMFQCIHAHEILVPTDEAAFVIAGFTMPLAQSVRDWLRRRLEE